MKRYLRRFVVMLACLLVAVPVAQAQDVPRVSGLVTSAASGQPISGVQVVVKGTSTGTITDATGRYTLAVPAGSSQLVFSFLGYRTIEAEITGPVVNVGMEIEAINLDGVVVTALGVVREKRDLGYSIQEVRGDKLTEVPSMNVVSALSGNAAGVQISSATVMGGTARIVIRGSSSIAGDNQPLFILDGLPIDNTGRSSGSTGLDYGNAASDIDPNNIESISILKGPNAAAIYGSRAQNGAVVITTKSGRNATGKGINASVGVTFETPLRLPEYQNKYGQGFNGEFRYVDGTGKAPGQINDGVDESWGPPLDGRLIDQFTGPQQPWVPRPNNVRDYFEVGRQAFMNASFARAGDRSHVRLSVSQTDGKGLTPGFTLGRTNVSLRGGVEMTEKWSANASINYVRTEGENRTGTGYEGRNPMHQFVWFGRQVDMKYLKENYIREDGTQLSWNTQYWNNPYWVALVNKSWDWRDRITGNVGLTYQPTEWLSATLRTGRDSYTEFRKQTFAVGTLGDQNASRGRFNQSLGTRSEINHDLMLTAQRELTPDITLTATAGGGIRINEREANGFSVAELSVPGIYSLNNAGVPAVPNMSYSKKQVNSLLGSASVSYKGFWSVDLTGRNDWSSTLPKESHSFFYPSVSTALIFTDAFNLSNNWLSSGKIRASWAKVGNDTNPYQLLSTYSSSTPFDGIPGYSVPSTLLNANLKPEETLSWEAGTDLGFFNERLGFVLTYYNAATRNQILSVSTAGESGYSSQFINAGEVKNWGWELQLNTTPIRDLNGFNWNVIANWAKNNSMVTELFGDLPSQALGSYGGVDFQARLNEPYGAMYAYVYKRDPATGKKVVDARGLPIRDTEKKVVGNYNPDWTAGLINRFTYGSLDLSIMIDGRMGGKLISGTSYYGKYAGVLIETLKGRENSYEPVKNALGQTIGVTCDPGIVVDGVYDQGVTIGGEDMSGKPNQSKICGQEYFHRIQGISEEHIYDASFIKLREVRLGYRVPRSVVSRLGFSSMNVAVVGRNLWLGAKVPHIDPESTYNTGNAQGYEYGQLPTSRSVGFTISVTP